MSDQRTDRDRCCLCGTAITESNTETGSETGGDGPFCSTGCRDVAATLGKPDSADSTAESGASPDTDPDDRDDALTRTFFRVDGMHSALCEKYLESIAEGHAGVSAVAASYVTESVRVDHDPDRVSAATLEDALTTTGYTAYRREKATDAAKADETADDSSSTRRSREMQGMRKRRSEDMLEVRYIIGIVFGSFLLVPYVTVLYPVYLSAYTDYWLFERYGETFATFDGMLFLPIFLVVTGAVLYLTGMPLLRGAYVSLTLRRPSTHLFAALSIVAAFCYGTISFVVGDPQIYYDLTILVAATVMAAIFYEELIKRTAVNRLTELTVSQVGTARVLEADGTTRERPVEEIEADDRLLVRAGERIPVDGTIAEGECTVDEAVITGESLPVSKAAGDEVVGGSVVTGNAAVVAVGERTTSSIDQLTRTVWNLQSADHGVQRRADALAGRLLPVVAVAVVAVGLGAVVLGNGPLTTTTAALVAIIAVSPWALALATPYSIATSIRDALEAGIVVFDESVFERLRAVDIVVFDKTGTLTTGEMTVLEADAPDDLLSAAGTIERRGAHPAAAAIETAFADDGARASARTDGGVTDEEADGERGDGQLRAFERHATGVEGVVDGQRVLVGHPDLFREQGWALEDGLEQRVATVRADGHLPVVVGRDGHAAGIITVGDEPRGEWERTVTALADGGVDVVVLTGDDDSAAARFRAHSSIDHVFANVSPEGKTAAIRRLRADNRVAMVGDGTNDAPALAAADLGISLGGGTALAADAADLAIVEDDLAAVERAFALARGARRRVVQNLWLALVYNAIVIPVALAGLLSPVITTAALAASGLLIVGNASRPLLEADRE
ncbi:heavy metal translocating P-type ATPase [Natronorubrum thiooxidans]|uniref:ATPase, P-type (Transporting), HAD superfamily, subfamily IC/heavy metal translocating P-type ATPase n=1 Tax=Natronorubrum thiooxidans TaxID=308853 RepID=A0A1N7CQC4_9EURY|nr:cation-translocating P-type ATPase [Natronorubrum thiooxidans]SIR65792.1 ATPase, P-type (transporting), HAD superfamily, subfamily IC/heavy metal translocating P-type ATPase [Natronorubrum thiooxidans]